MGHLGAMLSHLGVMLGDLGAMLGLCWAILGPCWAHVGPSWCHVGPMLGDLGAILGLCSAYVGPSWGSSWAMLGHLGTKRQLLSKSKKQQKTPQIAGRRQGRAALSGQQALYSGNAPGRRPLALAIGLRAPAADVCVAKKNINLVIYGVFGSSTKTT